MITDPARLEQVRRQCRRDVRQRALLAAAAGVVPLPGADIVADIGILSTMLPRISAAFELDHASVEKLDPAVAERVFAVAAGLGNTVIGRLVTRKLAAVLLRRVGKRIAAGAAARFVPVAGSAIAASIGFGAIKLAGDAHVEDCYRTARALLAGDTGPSA